MQEIEARSLPSKAPEFNTPEEAIEYSRARDLASRTGPLKDFEGEIIEQILWSDDVVHLRFASQRSIIISCAGPSLIYEVKENSEPMIGSHGTIDDTVILKFADDHHTIWDRAELIENLAGREFQGILDREGHLLLYVRGIGVYLICVFEKVDGIESSYFLHWSFAN